MKTVLITGATGFVGSHILRRVILLGVKPIVVVRNGSVNKLPNTSNLGKVITTDNLFLESTMWWSNILSEVDIVIHCAWYVEPQKYLQSELNHECFTGSIQLGKAAIKAGVKRFIGLGTCFEYDLSQKLLSVNSELKADSLYSQSKIDTFRRLSIEFKNSNVDFLWCRLFYLYGKGEDKRRLSAYVKEQIMNDQYVELSHGEQVRDFIDVKIAAQLIIDLTFSNKTGVKNICSGKGVTVRDFVTSIADEYGKRDLLKFGARGENEHEPSYIVGDLT